MGPPDRAKDIRIDDCAIAECDSNVALKEYFAGKRERSFSMNVAFRKSRRARLEPRITGFRDIDRCRFTKENFDPLISITLHIVQPIFSFRGRFLVILRCSIPLTCPLTLSLCRNEETLKKGQTDE
jgi:hypothetical protein